MRIFSCPQGIGFRKTRLSIKTVVNCQKRHVRDDASVRASKRETEGETDRMRDVTEYLSRSKFKLMASDS